MEDFTLQAEPRTILGKKVKKLRRIGQMPVVIYGHGIDTQALTVDQIKFSQLFKRAGINSLVNLKISDQKPFKALLHEPQRHPVTHLITHADIYKVKMTEKIKTEIPLEFINESPAVTELEGNLIINKDTLEVECLPDALVPHIEVDLSQIKTFDDVIHVSDIKAPEKMEILNDLEETIVTVSAPRSEAELSEELAETTQEEDKAAVAELENAGAPENVELTEQTKE